MTEEPDETEEPGAIEEPGQMEDQDQDNDLSEPGGKDEQVSVVQTGDDSGEWIVMTVSGVISLMLGAAVGIFRRKMKK